MAPALRVLIVDDDVISRQVLLHILHVRGDEAVACDGAEEALCLLARERFDVLLTDHVMDGMCGAELVRIAHRRCPDMRCVVLSGRPEPLGIAPQVPWLQKPPSADALGRALSGTSGIQAL
ncbi:MAG: hypothetical protein RL385_2861 [Pseudomonadota bacterium]|jgi:CheY-like chemotaxis protein